MGKRFLWIEAEGSAFGRVVGCDWCGAQWGPWPEHALNDARDWLRFHWLSQHGDGDLGGRSPIVRVQGGCITTDCRGYAEYASGECKRCRERRRRAERKVAL